MAVGREEGGDDWRSFSCGARDVEGSLIEAATTRGNSLDEEEKEESFTKS